jgi:hypothetical protein
VIDGGVVGDYCEKAVIPAVVFVMQFGVVAAAEIDGGNQTSGRRPEVQRVW